MVELGHYSTKKYLQVRQRAIFFFLNKKFGCFLRLIVLKLDQNARKLNSFSKLSENIMDDTTGDN